ncbi:MAG: MBL fold metallo-hydrolase [Candidatus Bathyarchaeota archaeon]|nr:MBL fold metallo-hydrolase [Candidatus Bathyarchaeota archaeon]
MTKMFTGGLLSANYYVVSCKDTLQAAIIDPGFDSQQEFEEVTSYIAKNNLEPKFIVNTHGHPDHTSGNQALKDKFHVPICIHQNDAYMLGESGETTVRYFGFGNLSPDADILLHEGSYIKFGDVTLTVVHTPGHSFGNIVLLGETEVFTGDTLFAGSIGRTDFPGSSELDMQASLRKLMRLPDYFVVYPGHGPKTTMGEEKRVNPFLRSL